MIASFLLSSSLVPVLSVWLLANASAARDGEPHAERLGRATAQPAGGAAAAARAGARPAGRGLPRRDRRRSSSRVGLTLGREIFPPSGANQFQLRFRAPAGTKFESTERLAGDVLDEIKQRGRPGQRRHHARLRRRAALVVSDQHDLPVDRRIARRRAAGGAQAGRAAAARRASRRTLRAPVPRAVSRRAVLVRARRHRQPDHELRRADAGRSRGHGPGLRREPRVRRRRCATSSRRFRRCAICSSGRRSTTRRSRSTSNRQLAGQLGVTVDQVGRSFAAATSSSRFVAPNYWADPRTASRSRCRSRCRSRG